MNLKPVSREEYESLKKQQGLSKITAVIEEFKSMDADCVEIEHYPHKSAASAIASFGAACRRLNCGVECKMVGGKVYLIKKEVSNV